MRIRKGLTAAVMWGLAIGLVPTTAYAVNVSSNDGFGQQSVNSWLSNGWTATGTLQSTHGDPVYYSGRIVYDWDADPICGRYTSDTTSLTPVSRGGTCSVFPPPLFNDVDGAKFRVCRNKPYAPDPCGSWSTQLR